MSFNNDLYWLTLGVHYENHIEMKANYNTVSYLSYAFLGYYVKDKLFIYFCSKLLLL